MCQVALSMQCTTLKAALHMHGVKSTVGFHTTESVFSSVFADVQTVAASRVVQHSSLIKNYNCKSGNLNFFM